jgi:predicted choloylglycine hydrolase
MITRAFSFRQLPPIQQDPAAWRTHLLRDFPGLGEYDSSSLPSGEARAALANHMPELLPAFDPLLAVLAGQPWAGRMLSMYNLRPFFGGCSVTIARRPDRTTLLRNYDAGPDDTSGVLRCEQLTDGGWILGTAEAGWGYLDGLNDRGLAVAITFGGRYTVGDGFAVPVLVRYLLETAGTVADGVERLRRLPHRLTQNFLLTDRAGDHAVVYTSPDRGVLVAEGQICATNHQQQVDIPGHARFVRTVERFERLTELNGGATLADLLRPPFYNRQYDSHFGTLYSVEYDPPGATARYAWPGRELLLSPGSPETAFPVVYEQE